MSGISELDGPDVDEVLDVYTNALRTVWQVAIGFAWAGLLVVFLERQYDMSRKLASPAVSEEIETEKVAVDEEKAIHQPETESQPKA